MVHIYEPPINRGEEPLGRQLPGEGARRRVVPGDPRRGVTLERPSQRVVPGNRRAHVPPRERFLLRHGGSREVWIPAPPNRAAIQEEVNTTGIPCRVYTTHYTRCRGALNTCMVAAVIFTFLGLLAEASGLVAFGLTLGIVSFMGSVINGRWNCWVCHPET